MEEHAAAGRALQFLAQQEPAHCGQAKHKVKSRADSAPLPVSPVQQGEGQTGRCSAEIGPFLVRRKPPKS